MRSDFWVHATSLVCLTAISLAALFFCSRHEVRVSVNAKSFIGVNRAQLVEWVVRHSRYTSRATAARIVDAALETRYPLLILALAARESGFDAHAVSSKKARGLLQIAPCWFRELKRRRLITDVRDLYDVETNIYASSYILDYLFRTRPSLDKVLESYVGGEHKTYVRDVKNNLAELAIIALQPSHVR